jgi:hypothetical protein
MATADEPEHACIRSEGGYLCLRGSTAKNSFRGSKRRVYHEMNCLPSFRECF